MNQTAKIGLLITWVGVLILGIVSVIVDWMPVDGGGFSEDVDWLYYFIYAVNVFFFLLIGGLMFTFAICGKQRPEDRDEVVHGATHNTLVEVAWTFPPLVIVLAIFVWGFRGYLDMATMPPASADAYLVDVEARQWGWTFTHENGASVSGQNYNPETGGGAVLDIPADRPVEFRLSATDVLHSLYFPAQRAKKDCVPGRYNRMWVEVTSAHIDARIAEMREDGLAVDEQERYADYPLHCTEYCGQDHSQMNGILRVWKPEYWDAQLDVLNIWNKENLSPIKWGEAVYTNNCASCHSVDGTPRTTGPTWKDLWKQERDGGPVDEQYILESIYIPGAFKVTGFESQNMSTFAGQLNYGDVMGVIAYIKSISGVDESEIRAEYPADREVYDGSDWLDENNQVMEPPALD